jgi:hypothetical protein
VYSGKEQNHEALPENTKDTIKKKMFLKVLSCICIFVFESKKLQLFLWGGGTRCALIATPNVDNANRRQKNGKS